MLLIWCYFNLVNLLNSKATIFMNFKFHGFKLSIQLSAPSPNNVGQFTSFQVLAREEFTYFPGCFLRSKWLACTQKENQQLLHFFPKNTYPMSQIPKICNIHHQRWGLNTQTHSWIKSYHVSNFVLHFFE
jgi:hypothetical protein